MEYATSDYAIFWCVLPCRGCAMSHSRHSMWLTFAAIAVYAFLYVPLAIVVIYSFNDSQLNAEWVGFTLGWYRKLFADEEMLHAAGNSLVIALMSSVASTV